MGMSLFCLSYIPNVLVVLLEYIDLFQSEWQRETNIWESRVARPLFFSAPCTKNSGLATRDYIWEGYPAIYHSILLYFILSIGIITNYKHILLKFAPIMPAFCLPIIPINLPAVSLYIEALKIVCPWMLFSR